MLGELIEEAARRFGERPAYVGDSGLTLTYADLDRLSDEVAAGLRASGVGAGDVVGLVLPTTPEYPVLYLAAAKVGAVTAGVNPRLSDVERAAVLDVASPSVVVATAGLAPRWSSRRRPSRGTCCGRCGARGRSTPSCPTTPTVPWRSCSPRAPPARRRARCPPTASSPRSRRSTWATGGTGGTTSLAGTTYMVTRWRADEALRFTAEHRLATIAGIPTQVALMLRVAELDDLDLSSVRAVLVGGGPATPALVREARERFRAPLAVRYSCTEAAIGVGTSFSDPPEDAEVSVGRALPGVELAVLDEDDRPVPAGEVGAVCLRSAACMSGYWRDPDATAAAFTADGFVRTGDLGLVDERGRLRLAGRTKEMYVRGGYNVYPLEVEAVLSAHPSVAAVAVVPRGDPVMGDVGVAVVVPRAGASPPTLEDLRAFAAPTLARHKLPEDVRVVDELPLTAMDKLDRRALAGMIADTNVS